ncbi:ATP-binding protein [Aureimonas pseudogalii]|uniref:Energy-coupling factor transporter ATP-binding protein EcfA2 n=1 Tax=Aureimonas pseudogalii TaxID=1744844 RepID=A0A7W6H3Q6_9HYPH|nr:ATP-binding protein [Aureimonas pseudogalii]MBB3998356.1 energy-coupling factor transporter ATP-binding protein EcfA2 [Aureimonas pseudogalii]
MKSRRPSQESAASTDPMPEPEERSAEADHDHDFLADFVSGLPGDSPRIVAALERVKDVYVPCGRETLLKKEFDMFLQMISARRNGKRDEGRCFFVTGESGAGKTEIVKNLIAKYPKLQKRKMSYGTVQPLISIKLQGPVILKTLGWNILRAAGYPVKQGLEKHNTWDILPQQLHHRNVMIIHIDEPQHLLTNTEANQERKNVAKAFKGVMNNPDWPVSFILSGMPETNELAIKDEQIERRNWFFTLEDVDMPDERHLVIKIISELAGSVSINATEVSASDVPDRVAHAARYRYGRIAQVVLSAIHVALTKGAVALERNHFVEAYLLHSQARGQDDMNPFLRADWRNLPQGLFMIETVK